MPQGVSGSDLRYDVGDIDVLTILHIEVDSGSKAFVILVRISFFAQRCDLFDVFLHDLKTITFIQSSGALIRITVLFFSTIMHLFADDTPEICLRETSSKQLFSHELFIFLFVCLVSVALVAHKELSIAILIEVDILATRSMATWIRVILQALLGKGKIEVILVYIFYVFCEISFLLFSLILLEDV